MKLQSKITLGCLFTTVAIVFAYSFSIKAAPTVTGPTALDATQVVTGGTAVTAVVAGTIFNGCYIQNDPLATTNLIIDPVNIASSASPTSTASFIPPGQSWNCPAASASRISVVTSDSAHKFYGVKF